MGFFTLNALAADQSAWLYATYLGGNGSDAGNGLAVDGAGNTFVTGSTTSTTFPTTSGAFQTSPAAGNAQSAFVVSVRRPPSNTLAFTCRLAATQGAA